MGERKQTGLVNVNYVSGQQHLTPSTSYESQSSMNDDDLSSDKSSAFPLLSFTSKELPVSSLLDDLHDAGVFALCGLVALLCHNNFSEEKHRPFLEKTVQDMVKYFKLPEKLSQTMVMMLDGEVGDLNSYIRLLHKEMEKKNVQPARLVQELIVLAVRDGVYDARLRVVILKFANFIGVSLELVELHELALVDHLSNETNKEDEDVKRKRNLNKKIKRYTLIALASVGGGVIIGLTGGLSAPLLAAGATAITSGAAILGSPAGVAVIGSLFGMAGAGLTGYKMNKRVGNIEEFAFEELTEGRDLHLTIAISGWISEQTPEAFTSPWTSLANSHEQYSLRYESAYLLELGRALDYFLGFAVSMAAQEALKYTLLSGIMAAIAWPAALVTMSSVIDNPWGVCIRRSAEVGKYLADILITRQQGQRPVSLIGFSLGARVIFFCLEELAGRKNTDGIIENVVLLGAPVSASTDRFQKIMSVVNGRLINGYCRDDWLLKFLYRTSTATLRIAGLQEINIKHDRMKNVDLTDLVGGHMDYVKKMNEVLEKIGVRVSSPPAQDPESELYLTDNANEEDQNKKKDKQNNNSDDPKNNEKQLDDEKIEPTINGIDKDQDKKVDKSKEKSEEVITNLDEISINRKEKKENM